jgi:Ca-activated chloride channel family protein
MRTTVNSILAGTAAGFALLLPLAACNDRQARTPAQTPPPQVEQATAPQAQQAPGSDIIRTTAQWGAGGKDNIDPATVLTDNWYVVFDGSGSMSSPDCSGGHAGGRIVDAKQAMIRFERDIPAGANLGLYIFDNNARGERVPLGRGPQNRAAFEQAVDNVEAGAGTPLGPSLDQAYAALTAQAARQGGYGSYHLVVSTDGQPDSEAEMAQAVDHIVQSPVVLETIGFCIASGHPLNRPGQTVYHNAMNPADLNKGLEAILAETDAFSADDQPGATP